MKRFFSITFVFILLLNVMGYYGVFLGLHYQNDLEMTRALNADKYGELETFTIKVPITIPYVMDQNEFRRVDGNFEHEGVLYRLVKQKYSKDTLTVVCVLDREHGKIEQAIKNYVETFTDHATKGNSSKISITFLKDYLPISFSIGTASNGWTNTMVRSSRDTMMTPSFFNTIIHPPERA